MASSVNDNSWEGVERLAEAAGARYPELVAAQWALESGWGKSPRATHNYFGLKATTKTGTDDGDTYVKFNSLKESVEYLVERWYKDYKQYKGINRSSGRETAARALKRQGYAQNQKYPDLLIDLMHKHAAPKQVELNVVEPPKAEPVVSAPKSSDSGRKRCCSSKRCVRLG